MNEIKFVHVKDTDGHELSVNLGYVVSVKFVGEDQATVTLTNGHSYDAQDKDVLKSLEEATGYGVVKEERKKIKDKEIKDKEATDEKAAKDKEIADREAAKDAAKEASKESAKEAAEERALHTRPHTHR